MKRNCSSLLWFTLIAVGTLSTARAAVDVSFEGGVPLQWSGSSGGVSVSDYHYKEGSQSLQWDWQSGDVLTVTDLQGQGLVTSEVNGYYDNTFRMWVYNEEPLADETATITFKDGSGNTQYHYWFYLDFKGWRSVTISYRYEMFGNKNSQDLRTMTVEMPAVASGGTIFFDRIDFTGGRIDSSASSTHIPYKRDIGDNHWSRLRHYSELPRNYGGETPTTEELADLEALRAEVLGYIRGGAPSSSSLSAADNAYNNLNISTNPDGTVKGKPLFGQDYADDIDLLEDYIIHYARDFYHRGTADSRNKFMMMIRHTLDQGYHEGSVMESVHHIGYFFRQYPLAVLLMKDELEAEGLWEEAYAMACWFVGLDGIWEPTADLSNMDAGNTRTVARYACIFFKPTLEEQVQYLKGFRDYVQVWSTPLPQTGEGIKTDYTGFHHNFYYPARYVNSAYKSLSWAINQMADSVYDVDDESKDVLKKTLLVARLCSNGSDLPMSLAGRGDPLTTINSAADGMKLLALSSSPTDEQLARAYNRIEPADAISGFSAEAYPNGFWQFNYGPMGVYRENDWVAVVKGFNNRFMGQEIYDGTSQYARYSAYGAVEILYAGGNGASGKRVAGWNWNATPGGTTIQLPWTELDADGREDEKTESEFCGALRFQSKSNFYLENEDALEGEIGLFAMDFQQKNLSPNHNPTFKFKKSVFCIDGKMICLGSGIQNDDSANPTITTLFQNDLKSTSDAIVVDGSSQTAFPIDQDLSVASSDRWLLDNVGTGYFVPAGNDSIKLTKQYQTSPQEDGTGTGSGNFAVAWLGHGTNPNSSSYEYVAVPQSSSSAIASFASTADQFYSVLQNDENGHVVKSGSVEAYALYAANSGMQNSILTDNSKRCLVMLEGQDVINMTVVDPVIHFDGDGKLDDPVPVELTLKGNWTIAQSDAGVSIVGTSLGSTTLEFRTSNGEPLDVQLTPAALVDDFTHTFSADGANELLMYTPINGAGIESFTFEHASADGAHFDEADDGYAYLHRIATSKATIGMVRSLGGITAGDVGETISVDIAFCHMSGLNSNWDIMLDNASVGGDGSMVISSFTGGQIIAGEDALLSDVALGDNNAERSEIGPLMYTIQPEDIGKSVQFKFSFYDSTNVGGEGERNLAIDAVVFRLLSEDEVAYWDWIGNFGLTNAADKAVDYDFDGDGYNNWDEFVVGTDPASGSVFPKITGAPLLSAEDAFVVQWNSIEGRLYDVYFSSSMTGLFSKVEEDLAFPRSSYTSNVEQAGSCGFYRVDVRLD